MMIHWLNPTIADPPHAVCSYLKRDTLTAAFRTHGWDPFEPALLGYPWEGRIQLIDGSHRWDAAMEAPLSHIPIYLMPCRWIQRSTSRPCVAAGVPTFTIS